MYHYRLFGGILHSDVEFPALEMTPSHIARWTLRRAGPVPPEAHGELLGMDVVTPDVRVRSYHQQSGLRLAFDDTGVFDVSADGGTITWHAPADASLEAVRSDVTNRVIAAALHQAGMLCLHGSAVVVDDVAVALLAPKRHGKSTLAFSLVRAGGRLLTDDTLPVEAGEPPLAHPGLHAGRLHADSAAHVALGTGRPSLGADKQLYSGLPDALLAHQPAPLDAVYLLSPTAAARDGTPVWRARLSAVESAAALMGNAKLAPLFGAGNAAGLFRAAATLARVVPVYRLYVVRDFDRLADVAETIKSWHAPVLQIA